MRTMVTTADEDLLVRMKINGNNVKTIADKTGYSVEAVTSILKDHKSEIDGTDRIKCKRLDRFEMIVSLYKRGYPVENIKKILNIGYSTIWSILEEHGIFESGIGYRGATVEKVAAFAETVQVGDKFKIVTGRDKLFDNLYGNYMRRIVVTVIAKYPHFAVTDMGDFIYLDLYTGRRV